MPGLYEDEFIGFRIATTNELDDALREAVVAIDANVLLSLYRFRAQTSRDLIKILQRLDDRLVVPHQALREFWRHRQRAAGTPQAATNLASDALAKSGRAMIQALEVWAKQVGFDGDELAALISRVDGFAVALQGELASTLSDVGSTPSGSDPILEQLDNLLKDRVTSPLDPAEWTSCVAEGRRRLVAEEPPGYKDAAKEEGDSPEGGAGDYLVWYQATKYAKDQDKDLVIVTADEKEDWWWRQQSAFLGPRQELTLEYHRLSGRRLFLLRPTDLLARAAILRVDVDDKSSADADRSGQDEAATPEWTAAALAALLDRLDEGAPVQAAVLRLAASSSTGVVSRDSVYELGDFPDDRMLRGFTRPLKRLTEMLQEEGTIPLGVRPILVAQYPDGVRTSYFSVPPEVPSIFKQLYGASGAGRTSAGVRTP